MTHVSTWHRSPPDPGTPGALGGFDVATGLSRQVDDNAACLHAINVLLGGDRGEKGKWAFNGHLVKSWWFKHGSLNVPIEHHPTIRYMIYNGYYKVMSNIPKMGHLPTPVKRWVP